MTIDDFKKYAKELLKTKSTKARAGLREIPVESRIFTIEAVDAVVTELVDLFGEMRSSAIHQERQRMTDCGRSEYVNGFFKFRVAEDIGGKRIEVLKDGAFFAAFSEFESFFRFMANEVYKQSSDVHVTGNIESTNHY